MRGASSTEVAATENENCTIEGQDLREDRLGGRTSPEQSFIAALRGAT
jgi:hypothetical protein